MAEFVKIEKTVGRFSVDDFIIKGFRTIMKIRNGYFTVVEP